MNGPTQLRLLAIDQARRLMTMATTISAITATAPTRTAISQIPNMSFPSLASALHSACEGQAGARSLVRLKPVCAGCTGAHVDLEVAGEPDLGAVDPFKHLGGDASDAGAHRAVVGSDRASSALVLRDVDLCN